MKMQRPEKFFLAGLAFFVMAILMATAGHSMRLEDGRFWKPTKAEQSKYWRQIGAQQERYLWAKAAGDVESAWDASLWPHQLAWLAQNEGLRLQAEGIAKGNPDTLRMASLHFDEAIERALDEEVYISERKDVIAKATRCLVSTRKLIHDLDALRERKRARRRQAD